MTRLIKAELYKLLKRKITLVLLLILMSIIILMVLIIQATGQSDVDTTFLPQMLPATMTILSSFGTMLAVILVSSAFGNEYGWNTMRVFLLCSESRLKMLTAKLIAVGLIMLAGMVISVIAALILGLIITVVRGLSLDLSFVTNSFLWEQFLNFWRTFYVMLPYVLLAFLFTIIGRSVVSGIGLGIGVFFLEPFTVALIRGSFGWMSKISDYLLYCNVDKINLLSQSPIHIQFGSSAAQMPGTGQAFLILTIYSLAFIVVAFFLFRKRDVMG